MRRVARRFVPGLRKVLDVFADRRLFYCPALLIAMGKLEGELDRLTAEQLRDVEEGLKAALDLS